MEDTVYELRVETDKCCQDIIADLIYSCNGDIYGYIPCGNTLYYENVKIRALFKTEGERNFCKYLLTKRNDQVEALNSLIYDADEVRISSEAKFATTLEELLEQINKRYQG